MLDTSNFDECFDAMTRDVDAIGSTLTMSLHSDEWMEGSKNKRKLDSLMRSTRTLLSKTFPIISDRRIDEITLTIRELVMNSAWDEECKLDNLPVTAFLFPGKKGILFRVTDQCSGFDHKSEVKKARENKAGLSKAQVLDSDQTAEDDYPGGTGMFCLVNFAQAFVHNELGNDVAVRFEVAS